MTTEMTLIKSDTALKGGAGKWLAEEAARVFSLNKVT